MSSRSNKHLAKFLKSGSLQHFKLPDAISLSDVNLPVLKKPNLRRGGWRELVTEQEKWLEELNVHNDNKSSKKPEVFQNKETKYIQEEIFGILLPALEDTLNHAKLWNALEQPKCFFNGIDHIAQYLWTNNSRYPWRKNDDVHIFRMPWAQRCLQIWPRPIYPKSWLWTEDYAALVIQRNYRRHLALKDPEVEEMRVFWEKLAMEARHSNELSLNPILLKKFASVQSKIVD